MIIYHHSKIYHLSTFKSIGHQFNVLNRLNDRHTKLMVCDSLQRTSETLSIQDQPGGGVHQDHRIEPTPPIVRQHQIEGIASEYKAVAKQDGIPFRPHGLFPHGDKHLVELANTSSCWPFEKHLPGQKSPYEQLPQGGWITGDAAAERGIDLRLFYREPEGEMYGTVLGGVRFGNGAAIGSGFFLSAHGGAVRCLIFMFLYNMYHYLHCTILYCR